MKWTITKNNDSLWEKVSDFCRPRKSSCNWPLVDIWAKSVHLFQCMTYKCCKHMTVALWTCLFKDLRCQSKALAILFFQQSLGEMVMAAMLLFTYCLSDSIQPLYTWLCNAGCLRATFPRLTANGRHYWETTRERKEEKKLPLPALVCILPASFITFGISRVWTPQKSKQPLWASPSSMTVNCPLLFFTLERATTLSATLKLQ